MVRGAPCLRGMRSGNRLVCLVLMLAVAAGQAGLCAGWTPTPESRMACCSEGGACPMHTADSESTGTPHAVSQVEADRCCAASEDSDSAPSPTNVLLPVTLAVVVGPIADLLPVLQPRLAVWAASEPPGATRVPKHLLLSVFLV